MDYMNLALIEAKKAEELNEVPVGVVIVKNNEVIATSYNQKMSTNSVLAHAEIIAINEASKKLNDWRLNNCEMYVTLAPCPMCSGAIEQSRINKVYIGTKSGFPSNEIIMKKIFNNHEFNHQVDFQYLNDERCEKILKNFFKKVRESK